MLTASQRQEINANRQDSLRRRANARNVSFLIYLRRPIHIINPVDETKLSCNTPHRRSRTVFSETYHLYSKYINANCEADGSISKHVTYHELHISAVSARVMYQYHNNLLPSSVLIISFKQYHQFICTILGLLPDQLVMSTPSKQTVFNIQFAAVNVWNVRRIIVNVRRIIVKYENVKFPNLVPRVPHLTAPWSEPYGG